MSKRKTSIELMRFLGAAMVVFVHCRGFQCGSNVHT